MEENFWGMNKIFTFSTQLMERTEKLGVGHSKGEKQNN